MHSVPSGRRAIWGECKKTRGKIGSTPVSASLCICMCTAHARESNRASAPTQTYVRVYFYYYYYYRHRHRRYTTMMIILYGRRRRSRLVRGGDGELSPPESVARRAGTRDDSRAAVRETRSTGSAVTDDAKIFTTRATSSLHATRTYIIHVVIRDIILLLLLYIIIIATIRDITDIR